MTDLNKLETVLRIINFQRKQLAPDLAPQHPAVLKTETGPTVSTTIINSACSDVSQSSIPRVMHNTTFKFCNNISS